MPGVSAITRFAYETAARQVAWPLLPVVIADIVDGEILYASQFAADLFGYTTDELVGNKLEMLVPREMAEQHSRWRQDALTPKTRLMGVGRQLHGLRKDGSVFPCHVGLTTADILGRTAGVAFVIDLTNVVRSVAESVQAKPADSTHGPEK